MNSGQKDNGPVFLLSQPPNIKISMTSIKVAISVVGIIGGVSSASTGILATTIPSISNETPISLTLGLVFVGVATIASAAWKISRAWAQMEAKLEKHAEEIESLKRTRSAQLRERLEREGREGRQGD